MADQESPNFTVTDKRHATASDTVTDSSASPESDATPSSAPSPDDTDSPSNVEDELSGSEGNQPFLPDPNMLLAMAGMQMETPAFVAGLLAVFDGHAWRALGLHANPKTGETTKDLPAAQMAIDCFQFLLSKVDGSLNEAERRESQRRLTDLRMNYLAKMREE